MKGLEGVGAFQGRWNYSKVEEGCGSDRSQIVDWFCFLLSELSKA